MKCGGVECQSASHDFPEARAKLRMLHDAARRPIRNVAKRRIVFIVDGDLPDAPETFRRSRKRLVQQLANLLAIAQVSMANDRSADTAVAIHAAIAHRAHAVGELHLAQRSQQLRSGRSRKRERLDIDARHDAMTGLDVFQVVLDHVSQCRAIEQVVRGIHDREVWLEDRLIAARVKLGIGLQVAHDFRFRSGGADLDGLAQLAPFTKFAFQGALELGGRCDLRTHHHQFT
ncbi:hypothetical protein D3C87_1421430 [compost metagenome]